MRVLFEEVEVDADRLWQVLANGRHVVPPPLRVEMRVADDEQGGFREIEDRRLGLRRGSPGRLRDRRSRRLVGRLWFRPLASLSAETAFLCDELRAGHLKPSFVAKAGRPPKSNLSRLTKAAIRIKKTLICGPVRAVMSLLLFV